MQNGSLTWYVPHICQCWMKQCMAIIAAAAAAAATVVVVVCAVVPEFFGAVMT